MRFLKLGVIQGRGLMAKDRGGTSDPYYKIITVYDGVETEIQKSRTIQKTVNPSWKDELRLSIEPKDEFLIIRLFDYDFGMSDDFLGQVSFDLMNLRRQARRKAKTDSASTSNEFFDEVLDTYCLPYSNYRSQWRGRLEPCFTFDCLQ